MIVRNQMISGPLVLAKAGTQMAMPYDQIGWIPAGAGLSG